MLTKTILFGNHPYDVRHKIAGYVTPHSYQTDDVITQEGALGTGLFVIVSGAVAIVHRHGHSDERRIVTVGPGYFFGGITLLVERPRGTRTVAKEHIECLALLRRDFKQKALENPEILWTTLERLAERLVETDAELLAGG